MTTDTPRTVTFEAGHTYLVQGTLVSLACPVCNHPAARHDAWGCQHSISAALDLPALRCRCAMPSIALTPKPGSAR